MIEHVSYFFGGAFLANSIPHLTNGISGRAFPTPFSQPRGQGESSASLNVLWAAFNLMIAYGLITQVGEFNLLAASHIGLAGLGGLLMALFLAWRFSPLYGGNEPKSPPPSK
ncbi:MAG TPA: hypothetical protein VNW52_12405 [Burkholderiaceae bacterium]|jgi:hypothetical protein|nr:hypothetical protein [Burkholderiaceae bacterium]